MSNHMDPERPEPRPNADPAATELYPIGTVADVTGVNPITLRAWERRYGKPRAVRLPSGHRRYTQDQVRWLRRIAEGRHLDAQQPRTAVRGRGVAAAGVRA